MSTTFLILIFSATYLKHYPLTDLDVLDRFVCIAVIRVEHAEIGAQNEQQQQHSFPINHFSDCMCSRTHTRSTEHDTFRDFSPVRH